MHQQERLDSRSRDVSNRYLGLVPGALEQDAQPSGSLGMIGPGIVPKTRWVSEEGDCHLTDAAGSAAP